MLRAAFKYTSYFLLFKLIADKILNGKVRFQSIIVDVSFLKALLNNENFKSLFFSTVYDNRALAKDRISLLGHILNDKGDKQMEKQPLKVFDKGEEYDNERNYSSYELSKENLQKVVSPYDDQVIYFILRPVPYKLDKDYVSYEIIPADKNKMPLRKKAFDNMHQQQLMNVQNFSANAFASEGFNDEGAFSYEYEVAGRINPSPPARPHFEFESQ